MNDEIGRSAAIDDPRVAAAMQQYLEALEAGQNPSRQKFLAEHADIAAELGGCLDGLELVHEAARSVRQADHAETTLSPDELKLPLGDYKIVREIGRGGMGIVYEATQLSLGRRVALKILPLAAALDPKHLQRFKNEAQAAAQLHHTNIVPVYAVGSERGVHYYAMQLIDGYSLADLIEQRRQFLGRLASTEMEADGNRPTERAPVARRPALTPVKYNDPTRPLTPLAAGTPPPTVIASSTRKTASERNSAAYFRTAAGLIRQAALALGHAHQLGVIHRDIKPANLLLDERGNLWVTDFGLAHFQANMQLTRTGDMLGTLRYMSPEQASGDRVVLDHRADVYSLGVTLYELLTLEPVIRGDEPHSVLRRIVEDEPASPRTHDKSIPRELETIVLKAIAKSPGDRYATAAELADDLQRWLDDQPIKARRPTLAEHAARWSRRHWALVTAAACILGVAALGLLISTIIIANEHSNTLTAYKAESQQRALADRQRQAADESFRQARQAVDTFLGLSEEELAARPTLAELRRRFLETALEYYNNFLDQRRDDPAVGDELLTTSVWVKQIVEQLAALERLAAFGLLANPFVQQELGLSDTQRAGLSDILMVSGAIAGRGRGPEAAVLSDNSRLSDQANDFARKIDAVLTPKQIVRLHQIALQQRGPRAFKNPEVVKALQLTAEQRKAINGILEEESPERRFGERRGMPPPPRDEFRAGDRPPPEFGDDRFAGHPPPPDGNFGPEGKKGGPPGKKGKSGGPPPGEFREFGGPRDKKGKPSGPPPDDFHEFGGPGPGRPPPPPPGERGGQGPGSAGGPGRRPPPPHEEELRIAAERATQRIVDLLTAEQKAKWQELVGPPFAYDLPPPRN